MAFNQHYAVVDLTDDSDVPSSSSTTSAAFSSDTPPSYVPSAQNPAKRSRIGPTNLNPLALLNPRAYIANGSSSTRNDIHSFPIVTQQEMGYTALSFNKQMENLHGLKDRKTNAPTTKEFKKGDIADSQVRHSGNGLLPVHGAGSANPIDLTGPPPFGK
jgi:hypothetical protein